MSENAEDIKTYRLETMKAYWPNTQIQTHIMSKEPSKWVDQVLLHSDVIYIHAECDENIDMIFEKIKSNGKKAGLALTISTNPEDVLDHLKKSSHVLLLTIPEPGSSGQKFDSGGLDRIKQLNNLSFRNQFSLCVDGGVNEDIVDATGSITTYCCSKGWQKQEQVQAYETQRRHGLLDTESTNWRRFPLSVRSHVYPETL